MIMVRVYIMVTLQSAVGIFYGQSVRRGYKSGFRDNLWSKCTPWLQEWLWG